MSERTLQPHETCLCVGDIRPGRPVMLRDPLKPLRWRQLLRFRKFALRPVLMSMLAARMRTALSFCPEGDDYEVSLFDRKFAQRLSQTARSIHAMFRELRQTGQTRNKVHSQYCP